MLDYNYIKTLTNSIKKKLQLVFKTIGYNLYFLIYGKITGVINSNNHKNIKVKKVIFSNKIPYKIYSIFNSRIYTDTVKDTAFIIDNKIIEGPSFQHRELRNSDAKNNIVLTKGTPKKNIKINGSVFSLLSGGGANSNYWHWMFDVLPRLEILKKNENLGEIDYFLFPDVAEKYQKETLDVLNIPYSKRLSSIKYRHIESKKVMAVDHPYVLKNNPAVEITNIPLWIINFLRKSFLKKDQNKNGFSKKFYIDRKDSKSNVSYARKIINEDEVKSLLLQDGYSIITLSELSFVDQVNLFNNATHIVGLHGAGFANFSFCEPKTMVLELKPISAGPVCENLAKNLNLDYKEISKPSINSLFQKQQGHIEIPLDELKQKIR